MPPACGSSVMNDISFAEDRVFAVKGLPGFALLHHRNTLDFDHDAGAGKT